MKIKSEIRKDYLLNRYVIITPSRSKRRQDFRDETILKRTGDCQFCPEHLDFGNIVDEIAINGKRQVVALNNIYPAVTLDNKKAYGKQEVIIETPDHAKDLSDLSVKEIEAVLQMHIKRTQAISQIKDIEYILCFKNQGPKAGASLVHAHSQILATKIIPPDISEERSAAQDYQISHGVCAYCDLIKIEMKSERAIFEDKYVAVFAPYASRYHYEAWIFTKRHIDNVTKLNQQEKKSLAQVLKKLLVKIDQLDLAYNFFFHQIIGDKDQHFYIKLEPRGSVWAGIELGSGLVINSVPPEEAAEFYRGNYVV